MNRKDYYIAVEFNVPGIMFSPSGQITITASSGQVTYSIDRETTANKFAQAPIEFFNAEGEMIGRPAGATVVPLDDYNTRIELTALSARTEFRFKVVFQDASGTVFRSSDPTIVIMRPGE